MNITMVDFFLMNITNIVYINTHETRIIKTKSQAHTYIQTLLKWLCILQTYISNRVKGCVIIRLRNMCYFFALKSVELCSSKLNRTN